MSRLKAGEGDEKALLVVASYVKHAGPAMAKELARQHPDIAGNVFAVMPNAPQFSCDLVHTYGFSDICDLGRCPFFASNNPVEFLIENAERITFNPFRNELKFYFPGVRRPLRVPISAVVEDRSKVIGEIASFTLTTFGVMLVMSKYRDPDTGMMVDPLRNLIEVAFRKARPVAEDEDGVSDMLLDIISSTTLVGHKEATTLTELFIYEGRDGRYLAIDPRLIRARAHTFLGTTSLRKVAQLLERYGIEKRRLRLHGDRKNYYLVPERTLKMLLGVTVDDLLEAGGGAVEDIGQYFVEKEGGD